MQLSYDSISLMATRCPSMASSSRVWNRPFPDTTPTSTCNRQQTKEGDPPRRGKGRDAARRTARPAENKGGGERWARGGMRWTRDARERRRSRQARGFGADGVCMWKASTHGTTSSSGGRRLKYGEDDGASLHPGKKAIRRLIASCLVPLLGVS